MRTNSSNSGPNPSQAVRAHVQKQGAAVCRRRWVSVTLAYRRQCASVLLGHSFGFTLVESRAEISSVAAQ